MKTWWYVTTPRATIAMATRRGVIVEGPPLIRRWIGRRFEDYVVAYMATWKKLSEE